MSRKNPKAKHIIFYQLQPMDSSDTKTDYRLHFQADEESGVKELKRWLHKYLSRRAYYWDTIAECYTIKGNGKYWLGKLKKSFEMVQGIGE